MQAGTDEPADSDTLDRLVALTSRVQARAAELGAQDGERGRGDFVRELLAQLEGLLQEVLLEPFTDSADGGAPTVLHAMCDVVADLERHSPEELGAAQHDVALEVHETLAELCQERLKRGAGAGA
tara:strand:+ start:573 stop:947 length:375 start_codon:yes stop_codon:yes gene_type:complete